MVRQDAPYIVTINLTVASEPAFVDHCPERDHWRLPAEDENGDWRWYLIPKAGQTEAASRCFAAMDLEVEKAISGEN